MLYLRRNRCLAVTSGCFKTLWKYRGLSYKSTSYSHRYRTPLTLKVNKDDEVIVLEVITPPEVKVLHKVPPAPRWTSVAITGSVIRPHLGGIVPEQLSIRCWRTETDRDRHEEWSCWLQSSEKAGRFNDCLVILWLVSQSVSLWLRLKYQDNSWMLSSSFADSFHDPSWLFLQEDPIWLTFVVLVKMS